MREGEREAEMGGKERDREKDIYIYNIYRKRERHGGRSRKRSQKLGGSAEVQGMALTTTRNSLRWRRSTASCRTGSSPLRRRRSASYKSRT